MVVVASIVYVTTPPKHGMCFFWEIPPTEELPHEKCRARRGEFDSIIPGVFGGFWVGVVEARRQPVESPA